MGWTFLTCIHGITEGLDNHSCNICQTIAKDKFGWDKKDNYIITNKWLNLKVNKKYKELYNEYKTQHKN